jgi:hypothetical protein
MSWLGGMGPIGPWLANDDAIPVLMLFRPPVLQSIGRCRIAWPMLSTLRIMARSVTAPMMIRPPFKPRLTRHLGR